MDNQYKYNTQTPGYDNYFDTKRLKTEDNAPNTIVPSSGNMNGVTLPSIISNSFRMNMMNSYGGPYDSTGYPEDPHRFLPSTDPSPYAAYKQQQTPYSTAPYPPYPVMPRDTNQPLSSYPTPPNYEQLYSMIPSMRPHADYMIAPSHHHIHSATPSSSMRTCASCHNVLLPTDAVSIKGNVYHPMCVVCSECRAPLSSLDNFDNGKFYCDLHYQKFVRSVAPRAESMSSNVVGSILSQPAEFQVANYNIHPPPTVSLDKPFEHNETIYAYLMEASTGLVISKGFQSGDSRVIRAKSRTVYFSGLKLSKMGPIKTELQTAKIAKGPECNFCIKFSIGNQTWVSDCFKIVSSCSQLPKEVKELVRPPKRSSNGKDSGNPMDDGIEDSPPNGRLDALVRASSQENSPGSPQKRKKNNKD